MIGYPLEQIKWFLIVIWVVLAVFTLLRSIKNKEYSWMGVLIYAFVIGICWPYYLVILIALSPPIFYLIKS